MERSRRPALEDDGLEAEAAAEEGSAAAAATESSDDVSLEW